MNFLFAKNEIFPYLFLIPIIAFIIIFISKKTLSFIKNIQKPKIIGVISDYSLNQNNQHNYSSHPIHIIREQYINNLSDVCWNYNVVFILIPVDLKQINKYTQIVDGVIFTGGADVDSKYYNQPKHPTNSEDSPKRTEFEIKFLKNLLKEKKPILSICRGMQLINIALGGDLIQDIPSCVKTEINHKSVKNGQGYLNKVHTVETKENSLLRKITNKKEFWVNSNHHQSIDKLGKNLIVSGISPKDNIIEAIEIRDYPNFFLGVQWHPEFIFTDEDKKIFQYFCKSL
jgi:putative glutamine amidotransferase